MESESQNEILLTIPPKAEYLVFCRLVLAGLARTREIDAEALADLKLAVTEACSNSIRHAYAGGDGGEIQVRYELSPRELSVEVLDAGPGFELPPEETPIGELTEEGMGIAIIRSVTDELEVSRGPGGGDSRLRFTRYLS